MRLHQAVFVTPGVIVKCRMLLVHICDCMTTQLCWGSGLLRGSERCVAGTAPSVPACCIAAEGVGSARSCLCSALGTRSAHYKWLPCHGHCGIQINKTGAEVSKQLLPRSRPGAHSSGREHVKVGKRWRCDLPARTIPSISPSLQQPQKARNDRPGPVAAGR